MLTDLEKEQVLCDFLDEFLADIFRVELAQEQERDWVSHPGSRLGPATVPGRCVGGRLAVVLDGAGDVLVLYTLVQFQPGYVALGVLVLETKVPSLSQPNCPAYQVEELLASGLESGFI